MAERPRVAISSCLLGERVRYDGAHKRNALVCDELSSLLEWKPICPEMGAGMGVPRPPIRLSGDPRRPRAVLVSDPDRDVSARIEAYARVMVAQLDDVCGYVFKSRSPSCALHDAPVHDDRGGVLALSSGLFAGYVRRQLPDLPMIDEIGLGDELTRARFVEQVMTMWRART